EGRRGAAQRRGGEPRGRAAVAGLRGAAPGSGPGTAAQAVAPPRVALTSAFATGRILYSRCGERMGIGGPFWRIMLMAASVALAPQPQIRQGLPGEFRRAGRVYAIAFDMD